MTTVTDSNVYNLAVKGTFDDCQDVVKHLFADVPFNSRFHLGAINSINWARILAQIVYYFSAYFQLLRTLKVSAQEASVQDITLQFCVPTGNFGDILAGWYAKSLGLPMDKLVVSTNENDILQRFWATGVYEKAATPSKEEEESAQVEKVAGSSDGSQATASGGVKATLSPAMDILVSSNFERLLWYLAFEQASLDTERNDADSASMSEKSIVAAGRTLKGWMSDLKSTGKVHVGSEIHSRARKDFTAQRISDTEVCKPNRTLLGFPISFCHTDSLYNTKVLWREAKLCIGSTHCCWLSCRRARTKDQVWLSDVWFRSAFLTITQL